MIPGRKWRVTNGLQRLRRMKLQQRYNKCRWDGAGRERLCNRRFSRIHMKTGCNNPVWSFLDRTIVQNQEKHPLQPLESFQHPRPVCGLKAEYCDPDS